MFPCINNGFPSCFIAWPCSDPRRRPLGRLRRRAARARPKARERSPQGRAIALAASSESEAQRSGSDKSEAYSLLSVFSIMRMFSFLPRSDERAKRARRRPDAALAAEKMAGDSPRPLSPKPQRRKEQRARAKSRAPPAGARSATRGGTRRAANEAPAVPQTATSGSRQRPALAREKPLSERGV